MFDNEEKLIADKLSNIQEMLNIGAYNAVIDQCTSILEGVLRRIYGEATILLSYEDIKKLNADIAEIGGGTKGVSSFGLGQLLRLFRTNDLLRKWAEHTGRDYNLLDSLKKYDSINQARIDSYHKQKETSFSESDIAYKSIISTLSSLGYGKQIPQKKQKDQELANLKLYTDRGVIINIADGKRNISFKVDTINKLFEIAYLKIKDMKDQETADLFLYDMGYESGIRFGREMNEKYEYEDNVNTVEEKIQKWCEFDSVVGWGRFTSSITESENGDRIVGSLSINENFLCSNRRRNDVKLCELIKGYCDGVIEELSNGVSVRTRCQNTHQCPQENGKNKTCILEVI